MPYFVNLFSPETYEAFSASPRTVSGFRQRHEKAAGRISPGSKLICYLTKLSRWIGVLEVMERPFIGHEPIFLSENDPFIVRFHVRPLVWLPKEHGVPIHEDHVWNTLSFTRGLSKSSAAWTGKVRGSLVPLAEEDGAFLESLLSSQASHATAYPIDAEKYHKLLMQPVKRLDKVVTVSVPEDDPAEVGASEPKPLRESIRMQAVLASIGERMGFKIWLPKQDRSNVLEEWTPAPGSLLDTLPLNYDETTLRTIEQIDVLWLKKRAIMRAFEVEHTTAVYSGILRMADLLALQPNMDIKLHIVAPEERKEKVFSEIKRPVFSLLDKGPLSDSCTFLSYDDLAEINGLKHLAYVSDAVLEEYAEDAE